MNRRVLVLAAVACSVFAVFAGCSRLSKDDKLALDRAEEIVQRFRAAIDAKGTAYFGNPDQADSLFAEISLSEGPVLNPFTGRPIIVQVWRSGIDYNPGDCRVGWSKTNHEPEYVLEITVLGEQWKERGQALCLFRLDPKKPGKIERQTRL